MLKLIIEFGVDVNAGINEDILLLWVSWGALFCTSPFNAVDHVSPCQGAGSLEPMYEIGPNSLIVRCPPGCSPPHVVVYCWLSKDDDGTAEDVVSLIRRGIDVNARSLSGKTPLDLARNVASSDVQHFLVENGAN